jgi:acid phosphatase type 7
MSRLNRRAFLASSLTGAVAISAGHAPPHVTIPTELPTLPEPVALASLFLTWQRDPTTTMIVQWIGPDVTSDDDVVICYRHSADTTWQSIRPVVKPFPGTYLKVFRAELSCLFPGSEYQFHIGNNSLVHKFRTMPARATNSFTFVSGGDCGVNPHTIATNILAARQEPHFALLGGDLAYDNGRSPETFLAFLRNYSANMIDPAGRLIPLVACIGNHEVNGGLGMRREAAPSFLSVFDGLFRATTYATLDFGDYLSVALLDTGHLAPIGGAQTDWLEGTLRERESQRHLFVVNHVPAYPSARDLHEAGEENRKHWCPLFERHGVDAVLEHHDHTFKRTHPLTGGLRDKNGVLYLGDGSWGQLRTPSSLKIRPYLAAASKAYHMTVHRLEGDQRFHVALEESGRVADVCGSTGKRLVRKG